MVNNNINAGFSNFVKELNESAENNRPVEMVSINTSSPVFNTSALFKTINDIPNMTNDEIRIFVLNNFISIIQNVFNSDEDTKKYIKCFTNVSFLDAFIEAASNQRYFTNDIIIRINNICYDYISLKSEKDMAVLNRMINIGNIINRANLPRLLGLGLNPDLASILLIARFSSFELDIVIRRVNLIIITQPKTLMNCDMIMQIFKILYGDYKLWGVIFQYFMFDTIPEYNENNINSLWVSEEVEEINSIINLVILQILNETPTPVITQALINYAEYYAMTGRIKPIRFSMRRLSGDYGRIISVIEYLQWAENVYVP